MKCSNCLRQVFTALASIAIAASVVPIAGAQAQDFPGKPMKFIVPVGTGGLSDLMGRLLSQHLSARVGQPVIVENRGGAGGILGMKQLSQSAPDGYTVGLTWLGAASVNPVLYKDAPYETLRDFTPISQVASFPMVLLVPPSMPARTVKEFVELARAKPGSMNYGSPGNATTAHLATELFKKKVGIDMVHVAFKSEAPTLSELMAGRLSALFITLTSALPQINAGKVRALGIGTRQRSRLAPDIPTILEAGIPDVDVPGWYGVLAPAQTPKPIADRLNREFVAIIDEPEFRTRVAALGVEPGSSSPEAFAAWIRDETERWRKVVTDAGIKPD